MHITPSVKVIIVALVSIAGVSALLYYTYNEQQKTASVSRGLSAFIADTSKTLAELDSDADGLKNWEESLWGTDPEKKDSDGDGTSDGEEVLANRNPAKKGDDAVDENAALVVPDYFTQDTSVTEATGKELFARYLALKQSGTFSAVTQKGLVDDLANQILGSAHTKNRFTAADVSVVPVTPASASSYKERIQEVYTFITSAGLRGSEIITIGNAIQNNPENFAENMKALDPYIDINEQALARFKTIPAPSVIADAHLNFLNTYAAYIDTLHMIRNAGLDPIKGMVASGTYIQREQQMQSAYSAIRDYINTVS